MRDSTYTDFSDMLFDKLRALRKDLAEELALPAYMVFHDETLRQMALLAPPDRKSLLRIKGVGLEKLRQFGDRFITVIREHLEEQGSSGIKSSACHQEDEPAEERETGREERALIGKTEVKRRTPKTRRAHSPKLEYHRCVEALLAKLVDCLVTPANESTGSEQLLRNQVEQILSALPNKREAHIVRLRFGLEDGRAMTLEEIGKVFGVTRERIRQIEKKALRKLRHPSRLRLLEPLFEKNSLSTSDNKVDITRPRRELNPNTHIARIRKSHPRAYELWLPEEDQQLANLVEAGRSLPEITSVLGRQPSAIESRLNSSQHLSTTNKARS